MDEIKYAVKWDEPGERLYETGIDHGVLYLLDSDGEYSNGVAWNGLTSISENPSGAESTPIYADNIKYLTLLSVEEFGLTVEAYMYPDEFMLCDGSAQIIEGATIGQQGRSVFGLAYRTKVGTDLSDEAGYKIHLVWGAKASPSERAYQSVNDSPEAITFSWEITTTPVPVAGHKATASMVLDSTKIPAAKLAAIEALLYGTEGSGSSTGTEPTLPMPDDIIEILEAAG